MKNNILKTLDSNAENLKLMVDTANKLNPVKPLGEKGGKLIGKGIDKLADYIFGKEVV
ncbi:MAG: hypothetical protein ACOCUI_05885 [bacterium]